MSKLSQKESLRDLAGTFSYLCSRYKIFLEASDSARNIRSQAAQTEKNTETNSSTLRSVVHKRSVAFPIEGVCRFTLQQDPQPLSWWKYGSPFLLIGDFHVHLYPSPAGPIMVWNQWTLIWSGKINCWSALVICCKSSLIRPPHGCQEMVMILSFTCYASGGWKTEQLVNLF